MILVQVNRHLMFDIVYIIIVWHKAMMLTISSISGLLDPEAGMAQTLAHFYKWYCGCKSDQWEPLSEQHDHPQTAQWRGVWLLQWPDDPGEGQASQRQVTDLIYCITYVEQIVDVRSYIWVLNTERRRNIGSLLILSLLFSVQSGTVRDIIFFFDVVHSRVSIAYFDQSYCIPKPAGYIVICMHLYTDDSPKKAV